MPDDFEVHPIGTATELARLRADLLHVRISLQLGDKPIPAAVDEHMRVFFQRTDDMHAAQREKSALLNVR